MVKAFKMFERSESNVASLSNCQQSNKYNTASYNDKNNKDEIDEDDLLLQTFPEPIEDYISDYELPSYARCATHTLHLIAAVDTK